MAMTSYMKITGKEQGELTGDCNQVGREGLIMVYGFDHKVEIPRDPHSGLPTGQRIHLPYEITINKGKCSPQLFQACCTGEQVDTEHKFFRINDKGKEEHYFTIKLTNAIIVSMQEYNPLTFVEDNKPYKDMEKIAMTYESIAWIQEIDGVESEDSWTKPNE